MYSDEFSGAKRVNVVVRDVEMSFWSMVVFLVKLSLAAIPAFIILAILYAGALYLLTQV